MKTLIKLGLVAVAASTLSLTANAAELAAGTNSSPGVAFSVADNDFLETGFDVTLSDSVVLQFAESYSAMGATAASQKGSEAAYGATTEGGGVIKCTDDAAISSAGVVSGLTAVALTGC